MLGSQEKMQFLR